MSELKTELTQIDDSTWRLKLKGIIDSDTRHRMWVLENSAILLGKLLEANAKKLLIDLTEAERFDSHGLRLLLNAQKEFSKENVEIVLKSPNSHMKRLFQIMQFDRVFIVEFDD